MSIQINYFDDGIGIEIALSGKVTGKDVIEKHKELFNDIIPSKEKYRIINRINIEEYSVSPEEVKEMAELDKAVAKVNPNLIIALVTPSMAEFKTSKAWQTYVKDSSLTTGIFADREKAYQWIQTKI